MSKEIDNLINEAIFGRKPCKYWTHMSLGALGGPMRTNLDTACPHLGTDDECYDVYRPQGWKGYSDGYAAMEQLIEKMHEEGYRLGTYCQEDGTWDAIFTPPEKLCAECGHMVQRSRYANDQPTLPMAVALAALNAKGIPYDTP